MSHDAQEFLKAVAGCLASSLGCLIVGGLSAAALGVILAIVVASFNLAARLFGL